jgi:hypothetical protein
MKRENASKIFEYCVTLYLWKYSDTKNRECGCTGPGNGKYIAAADLNLLATMGMVFWTLLLSVWLSFGTFLKRSGI